MVASSPAPESPTPQGPARPAVPGGLFVTYRRDNWWVGPLVTALVLIGFSIYATYVGILGSSYQYGEWGPYLSPFYSPKFQPSWWTLNPAILILGVPLLFRATCYYYRKAYYRAFFLDPPACSVGEKRGHGYKGETAILVVQNLHRYFFLLGAIYIVILGYDAVKAFVGWDDGFHVGVGSLVMTGNVVLLALFTFSCHAWRHLMGGKFDNFDIVPVGRLRRKAWQRTSRLNENHMLWAWSSMFSVALTDLYIRLVAMGVITDVRIF